LVTQTETYTYYAPGRVNLIGEHLDYNLGHVLPAAISLGIQAKVKRRNDRDVVLTSTGMEENVRFPLDHALQYTPWDGWGNYPKGIFAKLKEYMTFSSGFEIHYESDLPIGSGLSSSAAIEVLTAYLLLDLEKGNQEIPALLHKDRSINRIALAELAKQVENDFVGVNCGIMDQYSIANGKENHAIRIDCDALTHEYVPIHLEEFQLLIMNTCKPRTLLTSEFNQRRAECEAALALIQKYRPEEQALAKVQWRDIERYVEDEKLKKRARHVFTEHRRVQQATEALTKGDIMQFGYLMNASHESLRFDYGVTGKELDCIVYAAKAAWGCIGARMTGAGFGGCALALVRRNAVERFSEEVTQAYRSQIGYDCELYAVDITDGVRRLG